MGFLLLSLGKNVGSGEGCMLAAACDARIMLEGKKTIGTNEIGFAP
jgi:enoyl-CoA hydratase/carnithine racemase